MSGDRLRGFSFRGITELTVDPLQPRYFDAATFDESLLNSLAPSRENGCVDRVFRGTRDPMLTRMPSIEARPAYELVVRFLDVTLRFFFAVRIAHCRRSPIGVGPDCCH
jgi:hypothetical protein